MTTKKLNSFIQRFYRTHGMGGELWYDSKTRIFSLLYSGGSGWMVKVTKRQDKIINSSRTVIKEV